MSIATVSSLDVYPSISYHLYTLLAIIRIKYYYVTNFRLVIVEVNTKPWKL